MKQTLRDFLCPQPKSKIKAGDGQLKGAYNFYTSSQIQSKFYHSATYTQPALIFGTGGMASVHYCNEPFSTSTDCLVMYGRLGAPLELIYYYLRSNMHLLQDGFKGAGLQHISKDYILNININMPAPSLQEQITHQMRLIDAMINGKKQQILSFDEAVKSRFIELFGDPQRNPHGYKHTKLSDIATYYNGLTYKPENVAAEGTIVLRSSNIQNSQLDFADTIRVDCAIKERLMVQKNDILMCSRNGSAKLVGKVALIKDIQEPMSFGAFMMIIRSHYFGYLMTYFQMDAFRQQIKTGATTTINQITGRMLDDVTIPLPPMALVDQFAAFVEQTDKSKYYSSLSFRYCQAAANTYRQEWMTCRTSDF